MHTHIYISKLQNWLSQDVFDNQKLHETQKKKNQTQNNFHRRKAHVHPGLLVIKISNHKVSQLLVTLSSSKGIMRSGEGRGRIVRTSLCTCPAVILFPSSAREERGQHCPFARFSCSQNHLPNSSCWDCLIACDCKNQRKQGSTAFLQVLQRRWWARATGFTPGDCVSSVLVSSPQNCCVHYTGGDPWVSLTTMINRDDLSSQVKSTAWLF